MSMRSPLLLIAAAQALIARGRHDARPTGGTNRDAGIDASARAAPITDEENGMRLVHHVGYWSHFSIRAGVSSWPFDPRSSLAALVEQARMQSLFVDYAESGDLVVRLNPSGTPQHIGIILYVSQRVGLYHAPTALCHVVWALPNHGEHMTAIEHRLWLRPSGRDRCIAWHQVPAPQARRRRAA